MKTIAVLNQKGGSGKSTLVECLAVAAELDGLASAILDMDPQGTTYEWGKRRRATAVDAAVELGEDPSTVTANPPVISVTQANYRDEWERLRDLGADLVIIDTPARLDTWAMNAAELADLVIIPAKPTVKDLERVEASIKLSTTSGVKPAFVVLNQVRPHGDRSSQAEDFIKAKKYPVCPGRLGFRVAFEDADAFGLTPQEYEPRSKAAQEIAHVYMYTNKLLHELTSKEVNNAPEEEAQLSRRAS
ncbi:MAG: ParA family protein [Pseudomonadota bacterium]